MRYYECWAGTKHPANHIPADATGDTLLRFHCACMGTYAMAPPVKAALERGETVTMDRARLLAMNWTPPRSPVVRVRDLLNDG
jgi:hypothetical protein